MLKAAPCRCSTHNMSMIFDWQFSAAFKQSFNLPTALMLNCLFVVTCSTCGKLHFVQHASDIFFFSENFPYFKTAPDGWKV